MSRPKPTPKPPPSRSWIIDPWTKKLKCYKHKNADCIVVGLWQPQRSDIHDAELQNATKEINGILDRVERDNEDSSRHLCFIKFRSRWMLAWSQHEEVVTSSSPDTEIAKALNLRGSSRPGRKAPRRHQH